MQRGRIAHIVDYHLSSEFEQHDEMLDFNLLSNSTFYLFPYLSIVKVSRKGGKCRLENKTNWMINTDSNGNIFHLNRTQQRDVYNHASQCDLIN